MKDIKRVTIVYTTSIIYNSPFLCYTPKRKIKKKADHVSSLTPKIQKGKIMRTVLFAYYLNNERKHEALYTEQRLDFMRSYKIRKRRKTVSDVEGCLV